MIRPLTDASNRLSTQLKDSEKLSDDLRHTNSNLAKNLTTTNTVLSQARRTADPILLEVAVLIELKIAFNQPMVAPWAQRLGEIHPELPVNFIYPDDPWFPDAKRPILTRKFHCGYPVIKQVAKTSGYRPIATSSDSPSPSILPSTSLNILYVPGNDIVLVNCHVASQKWDLVSPDFLSNVDLGGNTLHVEIRGGYRAEMEAAKSDPRPDLRAMKVELHQ